MAEAKRQENQDFNAVIDEVLYAYNVDPHAFEVFAGKSMQNMIDGGGGGPISKESVKQYTDNVPSWTRHSETEPGEGMAGTRAFCEELLEVFDSCGQSMEQMTMNLQEMKVSGLGGDVPDGTAKADAEDPWDLDFTQLTRFLNQDEGFWDELLTMQNEVPYIGGKIVIDGAIPKRSSVLSGRGRVLEDMLGVFDEFEEEITTLQANLLCESSDVHESDTISLRSAADSLHRCVSEEEDMPAVSGHEISDPEHPSSADSIMRVSDEPEEGKGNVNLLSPSPEPPLSIGESSAPTCPDKNASSATALPRDRETPSTASLRHGSAWDDLDVMQLKPTKQVLADSSCLDAYDHSPEGVALRLIASQLEAQALRPINVPRLLCVAAAGAGLVAYSAWYGANAAAAGAQASAAAIATHPRMLGVLWVAGFAGNVAAVSLPGRLDRMYSEKTHLKPWQSLFEPSNWAFAIWAVIYLLEAAMTVGVLIALNGVMSAPVRGVASRLLPLWMGGNSAQALWCFLFRPEFSSRLWAPTLCLFLAAACYCAAHAKVDAALELGGPLDPLQGVLVTCDGTAVCTNALSLWEWGLVLSLRTALSTHSMWLLVSAVVTLNSWLTVSYGERVRGLLPSAGFLSAFVLFLAGAWLSTSSGDPMFALTTAWALDATAHRSMQKTAMVPSPMDKKAVSSDVHETLAGVESLLSGASKCVAAGTMVVPVMQAIFSFVNV